MLGAIAGDIIGRPYEMCNYKDTRFPLFSAHCKPTDDSILTIATAWVLQDIENFDELPQEEQADNSWALAYKYFAREWPDAGYGGIFRTWAFDDEMQPPYNSWGNGSAMRVSPIAYYVSSGKKSAQVRDIQEVLSLAKKSAEVTHNHPDGILGAQAVAGAVFIARKDRSKDSVRKFIADYIGYSLDFDYDELVENYTHEYACKDSVPQAIYTFLISDNFEDAIRKSISIGGDSDTIACICGAIAEPFYGEVPKKIRDEVMNYFELPKYERLKPIIVDFIEKYTDYNYF